MTMGLPVTAVPDVPNFTAEHKDEPFGRFIIRSDRITHPNLYLSDAAAIALYETLGKALAEHTGG